MVNERVGVAVIGCGLIGTRRARTAAAHPATTLRVVTDTQPTRAHALAQELGAEVAPDWEVAVARDDVAAVVVCTPNAYLVPIACAALARGRHVLIEKPMGRNLAEAEQLAAAAAGAQAVLKIGFNHRYHTALERAHALFDDGAIGRLVCLRARYGHGSRPGCEREWRADPQQAGGGELLDQGVHVIDLFHWFAGEPVRVHAELQTAAWAIGPLEDNAFALLRYPHDVVGQFHVSMTQWKNLFSLEVHGDAGALVVEGLGGSYGTEQLTLVRRNPAGGVPQVDSWSHEEPDPSWSLEWADFAGAATGGSLRHGSVRDGLAVMRTVEALYGSAGSGSNVGRPGRAGSGSSTGVRAAPERGGEERAVGLRSPTP